MSFWRQTLRYYLCPSLHLATLCPSCPLSLSLSLSRHLRSYLRAIETNFLNQSRLCIVHVHLLILLVDLTYMSITKLGPLWIQCLQRARLPHSVKLQKWQRFSNSNSIHRSHSWWGYNECLECSVTHLRQCYKVTYSVFLKEIICNFCESAFTPLSFLARRQEEIRDRLSLHSRHFWTFLRVQI